MLPSSVDIDSLWNVLPPGMHDATMEEIENRFATNDKRKALLDGFRRGCESLRRAGCKTVFLDGSFISDKPMPGDFDACWEPTGVDHLKLDPVLLDFDDQRRNQKAKYGGEFFPSSAKADGSRNFVEFFRIDTYSGKEKGLIRIHL